MNRPMIIAAVGLAVALSGCESMNRAHQGHAHVDLSALTKAVCVVTPTAGNTVSGVVTFTQMGPNVRIVADLSGLDPFSDHAWHIHEYGDIRSADGTATGGHYNPEGHDHGLPLEPVRHAGDLGNITADGSGQGHAELTVRNCTIGGAHNPIIGRSIIVHAEVDDGGQPTGNAGARIGQGVIGVAKSE